MKTSILFRCIIVIAALFAAVSCKKEDALTPSDGSLLPHKEVTQLDRDLSAKFESYNCILEYRYDRTLIPTNWYYITAIREDLVLNVADFLIDYWIKPLEAGSNQTFVKNNFPRMLYVIGSPAYQKNGSRVLGQAEGGTLVRFTEMNNYNISDVG